MMIIKRIFCLNLLDDLYFSTQQDISIVLLYFHYLSSFKCILCDTFNLIPNDELNALAIVLKIKHVFI